MDWSTAVLLLTLRAAAMQPRITESVTVVAMPRISGPGSATVLTVGDIQAAPALALDDALRATPGFTLFRRSSSRVANPTTQGVTMRGLAASGASRAAVEADNVPLTDPVGGWVHWNRIPAAAVARVEVLRGPAGDLVSDALGGTIRITTRGSGAGLLADGGSDGTARVSGVIGEPFFAAAEWFTTDGYVTVAPESRGSIDTRASSRHASLHLGSEFPLGRVSGAYFGESRGNGTPFQTNSTRQGHASGLLFGQAAGGSWMLGSFAARQRYEQTFSAVLPGRSAERPTSEQRVDALSGDSWMDWGRSWQTADLALTGSARYVTADLRDVAADAAADDVSPLRARQFSAGLGAHTSVRRWESLTVAAGIRANVWTSWRTQPTERSTSVFLSPRLSVVYLPAPRLQLRAAVQSGSRGPTINELYRAFRVGSVLTLPNSQLTPEDATGIESSVLVYLPRRTTVRVVGFWSRVGDAIANVTQPSPAGLILRQRLNAARIRARGAELEAEAALARPLVLTASAAMANAEFDRGPLDGLRVPQVPRFQAAFGARGTWPHGRVAAEWRFIGRQFDDDRNEFELARSSMLDVRAGWLPRRNIELFVAVENVLDEEQDVGRTPIRTIGLPRTLRVGVRVLRR